MSLTVLSCPVEFVFSRPVIGRVVIRATSTCRIPALWTVLLSAFKETLSLSTRLCEESWNWQQLLLSDLSPKLCCSYRRASVATVPATAATAATPATVSGTGSNDAVDGSAWDAVAAKFSSSGAAGGPAPSGDVAPSTDAATPTRAGVPSVDGSFTAAAAAWEDAAKPPQVQSSQAAPQQKNDSDDAVTRMRKMLSQTALVQEKKKAEQRRKEQHLVSIKLFKGKA